MPSSPVAFARFVGVGEEWTGGVELREAHQAAGVRDARALVELQPTGEAALDRHAALEQPGRDLECPGLRHRDSRDRASEQFVVAGVLGVGQRGASMCECVADATLEQAYPAEVDEDLRRAPMVVACLGERALAPSGERRQVGAAHAGEREQHVGTLFPRWHLG